MSGFSKAQFRKSEGKHFTRFCCKDHPAVPASGCVSGNRHKSCGTGVESNRAVLSVWRRKKAHGSTGISGMFPVGESPECPANQKKKAEAQRHGRRFCPRQRKGLEKAERQNPTFLKADGTPSSERTMLIKGNRATGKVVRIIKKE